MVKTVKREPKKPYSKPTLTVYGTVRELTQGGGSRGQIDGQGAACRGLTSSGRNVFPWRNCKRNGRSLIPDLKIPVAARKCREKNSAGKNLAPRSQHSECRTKWIPLILFSA